MVRALAESFCRFLNIAHLSAAALPYSRYFQEQQQHLPHWEEGGSYKYRLASTPPDVVVLLLKYLLDGSFDTSLDIFQPLFYPVTLPNIPNPIR
jgi:hypothetical protein